MSIILKGPNHESKKNTSSQNKMHIDMDIYGRLHLDHQHILFLCDRIEEVENDRETIEGLFEQLKKVVLTHFQAEEAVFYDALKGLSVRLTRDAMEASEQHHIADMLLAELVRMENYDERWRAKFRVLAECLKTHIHEEEMSLFEDAKDEIETDTAREWGRNFEKQRNRLLEPQH